MDDRSIRHYANPAKVKLHVQRAIDAYTSLRPGVDKFNFTDGVVKDLVNLSGTIPVVYRQSTYNIPVLIWILDTYPAHPPLCYVKPAPNMRIDVSMTVDHCGKIYLPYLHDWQPASSDLLTLVQFLILSFSEKMPVFQVNSGGPYANPPNTPYPVNPSPYSMPPAPITTPYPVYSGQPMYPHPHPLLPPSQPAYPTRPSEMMPKLPVMPPAPAKPLVYPTMGEDQIRLSLLSAVEDKVRQNINEHVAQWAAELATLQKIQSELTQGKERIHHLMNALEREQSEWEKILTTLRDKDLELDAALLNLSNQGELDVDEAVVTTAPLYKQLLTAFAEEAATEDAIYYLGEALRRGVIDLDVFLKHVRSLSRKQFMLRALMNKCRNKAGLF